MGMSQRRDRGHLATKTLSRGACRSSNSGSILTQRVDRRGCVGERDACHAATPEFGNDGKAVRVLRGSEPAQSPAWACRSGNLHEVGQRRPEFRAIGGKSSGQCLRPARLPREWCRTSSRCRGGRLVTMRPSAYRHEKPSEMARNGEQRSHLPLETASWVHSRVPGDTMSENRPELGL